MDLKAMAKSKRSHTQHHNPKKPHQPSKPTTTTSTKKEVRERNKGPPPPPPPSLPSNWDRYQDEVEDEVAEIPINSGFDDPAQLTASNPKNPGDLDVPKPKSKGADYTTLIAQAKESRSYYSPSFDDKLPDSYQGVEPMLAVRGEAIYLQDRDEYFLMENEGGDTQEAPFLTLDLKDLAERLSKVDLAKRLFVEPDLFPPELHDQDENNAANPVQSPERRKILKIDSFSELLALYLEEEEMAEKRDVADEDSTFSSSNLSSCHVPEQNYKADLTEIKLNDLGGSALFKSESEDLEFLDKGKMPHSHANEQNETPSSRFEVASAEAELDMLLGSFNETKIIDTPTDQPGSSSSYNLEHIATYGASIKHPVGHSGPGFPVTSSLDDELDDLLADTSNLNTFKSMTHVPSSSLSNSQPDSKPEVLQDFDSWMDTLS